MRPTYALFLVLIVLTSSCGEKAKFRDGSSQGGSGDIDVREILSEPKNELDSEPSAEPSANADKRYIAPYLKTPLEDENYKLKIDEKDLAAGSTLVGLFRYSILHDAPPEQLSWLTKQVVVPASELEVLADEFPAKFRLDRTMSLAELEAEIANDAAIVTIDVAGQLETSTITSKTSSQAAQLLTMGTDAEAFFARYLDTAIDHKVKVGIIDTGLAYDHDEFKSSFGDRRLTNVLHGSNDPRDQHGHGSMITSIIASKSKGLATSMVTTVPLLVTEGETVDVTTLIRAINVGTNLGVEVMNISLGGNTKGSVPILGHAIFRAIQKGVFFSFSAGNGIRHIPEATVGYPITAARDDGPLNFQLTQFIACWGKYFLGALTTGAIVSENGKEFMPIFSNYGEDVEMVAPGVDVPVINHLGEATIATGTSVSAAFTTAAAAMAIHHHKVHGFGYTPWYIENLLVESARLSGDLNNVERHPRFGSVLSFDGLASLLGQTESMTQQERDRIRTVNPRYYEGWIPGRESNLDRLDVVGTSDQRQPGDRQTMSMTMFYRHNQDEKTVTNDKHSYWFLSLADKNILSSIGGSSAEFSSISSGGEVTLAADRLDSLRQVIKTSTGSEPKKIEFVALGIYDENQHQAYNTYPFIVVFGDKELSPLEIAQPASKIRAGQTTNTFSAFQLQLNAEKKVDVTGSCEWSSSHPEEFRSTGSPGVFSALNARVGATYKVFAKRGGQTAEREVTLEDEQFLAYEVRSSLGDGGNVVLGQNMTLSAKTVFATRDESSRSDWYFDGVLIAQDKSQIVIETGKVNDQFISAIEPKDGNHEVIAKSTVKLKQGDMSVENRHAFVIKPEIEKIEISLKDPVVREGGELLLNVLAYYNNNSKPVVTSEVLWTVSHPDIVEIQTNGKATVADGSARTKITLVASFNGESDKIDFTIVEGSSVTGSESKIVDLVVEGFPDKFFCTRRAPARVIAVYEDGKTREVTASVSTEYLDEAGNTLDPTKENITGGGAVLISYAYNDGSAASGGGGNVLITKEISIPKFAAPTPLLGQSEFKLIESTKQLTQNPTIRWVDPGFEQTIRDPLSGLYFPECAYNISVRYDEDLGTTGSKNMILEWDYNSNGEAETITNSLPFTVVPFYDKLLRITTERDDDAPIKNVSVRGDGYPFEIPLSVYLYFEDNKGNAPRPDTKKYYEGFFKESDFSSFDVTEGGSSLLTGDVDASWLLTNVSHICHDGGTTLNREVLVKHAATTSQVRFKVAITQESKAKTNQKIASKVDYSALTKHTPLIAPIPASDKTSTLCTQAQNNDIRFSGGDGSMGDPYLICTTEQLLDLRSGEGVENSSGTVFARLEAHIDFDSAKIPVAPLIGGVELDGNGFEVRNFVLLDSEANNVGLLGRGAGVRNLGIRGALVVGRQQVGAVCGFCRVYSNVYVSESSVTGRMYVGAVAGWMQGPFHLPATNIRNDRTSVYGYISYVGGIAGQLSASLFDASSTGDVSHIGVPGISKYYGGIGGAFESSDTLDALVNVKSTGNVVASGKYVGGIVGSTQHSIFYAENRGSVVNTGTHTGGIVGAMQGIRSVPSFTIVTISDPDWAQSQGGQALRPIAKSIRAHYGKDILFPKDASNGAILAGSKNFGNVWGGLGMPYLDCVAGIKEILGNQGSYECDGDEKSSNTVGSSMVGGIVGYLIGFLVDDNVVNANVRGVTNVGGIVGVMHASGAVESPGRSDFSFKNNYFEGLLGASDEEGVSGKIVGYLTSDIQCFEEAHFVDLTQQWFGGSTFKSNEDKITWGVGAIGYRGLTTGIVRRVNIGD